MPFTFKCQNKDSVVKVSQKEMTYSYIWQHYLWKKKEEEWRMYLSRAGFAGLRIYIWMRAKE
jgi:hypothetical protein